MTDEYEVGYRKPPKSGRFQSGRSGNVKGRPKGTKNFKTDFQEELETQIEITEGSKKIKVSKQRAFIKRLINGSLNGDAKSTALAINIMMAISETEEAKNTSKPLTSSELKILQNYMNSRGCNV